MGTTIAKLILELDKINQISYVRVCKHFGVKLTTRQPKIKRMSVKNIVIDGRGKENFIEVTNTPLELLINFRNKYLGHGTVYSEVESKRIYNSYEPILISFLSSLIKCDKFQFLESKAQDVNNSSSHSNTGKVIVEYNSKKHEISNVNYLKLENKENSDDAAIESTYEYDSIDNEIIESYPYFLAHP